MVQGGHHGPASAVQDVIRPIVVARDGLQVSGHTSPQNSPAYDQRGFWPAVWRVLGDVHAEVVALSSRVAASPGATLLASGVALAALQQGEFVDLAQFRELLPRDCLDVWGQFVVDPESGAQPVAALALGELAIVAKRQRVDWNLPVTSFDSERTSQAELASGITALLQGKDTVAAAHFHVMAAIDVNRHAPAHDIALAYAMQTFAHLQAGDAKAADEAQRHWRRLYYHRQRRPVGFGRRQAARLRAILLETVGKRLVSSEVGDRALRVTTALLAYDRARAHAATAGDFAAVLRINSACAPLQALLERLAHTQGSARHPTIPDASTQERLLRAVALVQPVADGPLAEAAVAAVQYCYLREWETPDRDTAIAQWAELFFAHYPAADLPRQTLTGRYRATYSTALLTELLCYGLIPKSLRPYMNAAVRDYADFLRLLHDTLETTALAFTENDDGALLLHAAMILRLSEHTLHIYTRGGYKDGVERLEHLRHGLQPHFDGAFIRLGMQAYRALRGDPRHTQAALVPWAAAYYLLHPADAALREQCSTAQQSMFDQAVLAEQMGNHLRMSPNVDILQDAYRALRLARDVLQRIQLPERAKRLEPLLRDLQSELTHAGAKSGLGAIKPSGVRSRDGGSGAGPRPPSGARIRDTLRDLMAQVADDEDEKKK